MTTLSINQPAYLPWAGYFDRIVKSDIHIVLDHVQFEKNSMTNRNKIRTKEGWAWLTVPVKTKGRFGDLAINRLEIDNTSFWAKKHLQALRSNYARAPFFVDHFPFFDDLYGRGWACLAPLIRSATDYLTGALGIGTEIRYGSAMAPAAAKEDLVIELCRKVHAKTYISGPLGRNYLHPQRFRDAGIDLLFHDYPPPHYRQSFPGFEPYMSVIDLLFNCGPESLAILKSADESLVKP